MKRTWVGHYVDIGKDLNEEEFPFRIDVELNDQMSFTGTIKEDEFYKNSQLLIPVKGFIDKDHISFVLKYPCLYEFDEDFNTIIDKTQKGHEITYDGYWDNNEGKWAGYWELKGETVLIREGYYEEEETQEVAELPTMNSFSKCWL